MAPPSTVPNPAQSPAGRLLVDPAGTLSRAAHAAVHLLTCALPVMAAVAAIAALAAIIVALAARGHRAALARGARVVTILAPPEVEPSSGEAFWRNLHDLLRPRWRRLLAGQPHLAFEYSWSVEGARISVWAPGAVPPGMVERAAEAAWPAARTHTQLASALADGRDRDVEVSEPLVPDGWQVAAGQLRLANPDWFPLRTEFDTDPLRAVMGAAAVDGPSEVAVVQVLARPAGGRAVGRCRHAARQIRAGRQPRRALRLLDLLTPGPTGRPSADPAGAADVRAVLAKADQPLWSAGIRYGVAAPATGSKREEKVLRGRAHALAAAFALYAGRNRLARRRLRRPRHALQIRALCRGDLLSTPELAALAHLPLDRIVPSLARARARAVPPPPGVGRDKQAGKLLGNADAGGERPVVLRTEDARHHLHVMGATGSGKSTLLTHLILGDLAAGRGAVVVDPKGDLVTDVLARLDSTTREKTVLLDPQDPDGRPKLNMLEVPDGVGPDLVVDHLVGIFGRIFERHWGPRLEDVLRSTCLTLLQQPGATLSGVPRLLADPSAHTKYLSAGSHEELRGFWKWYEALGEGQRAQVVGPLLYKLRAFLLRPAVREIVDARTSTLKVGELLDGGLLLVRVPKGLLGEDTARLLGSFVVAKVWQAATGRAALGQDARVDASLYVDECQNFLTLPRSFDEILAEARGYRLSLVLAHQHLGQLPRELRDAVSANARNKVLFTMSPEDAFVLARHTTPQLTEHDLANLDAYQAAVRLVVAGQDTPAFTLRTLPVGGA